MPKSDQAIIQAVTERMSKRRLRENESKKASFTMSYAVSVKTGHCYVGYNMEELKNKISGGTNQCAENRAAYVALSYDEKLQDLVFFTLNDRCEFFNACSSCQEWLWKARGFLKNQSQQWTISTWTCTDRWWENKLTETEREILFNAGDKVISEGSQNYFNEINFL